MGGLWTLDPLFKDYYMDCVELVALVSVVYLVSLHDVTYLFIYYESKEI